MTEEQRLIRSMKSAWSMTRQRCYNPKTKDYPHYGGRGIRICDRWLESFDNLLSDMGVRPQGHTLERKDNDGPYSPSNCVWATRSQQSKNTRKVTRITYKGETLTASEWASRLGIKSRTLRRRLRDLGYSVEDAMTKPVKCGGLLPGKIYTPRRKPDMSKVPRGFSHPRTKLSVEVVGSIRLRYAQGGHTFTSLSKEYGVSIETMSNAVQGLGSYAEGQQ